MAEWATPGLPSQPGRLHSPDSRGGCGVAPFAPQKDFSQSEFQGLPSPRGAVAFPQGWGRVAGPQNVGAGPVGADDLNVARGGFCFCLNLFTPLRTNGTAAAFTCFLSVLSHRLDFFFLRENWTEKLLEIMRVQ